MSRLLAAMGDSPMTSSQIMRKMGMTSKPYFLKNYMHPAIEHGFVSMTQPDKPLSSKQMYRKNCCDRPGITSSRDTFRRRPLGRRPRSSGRCSRRRSSTGRHRGG